jgi:hypothetical protein
MSCITTRYKTKEKIILISGGAERKKQASAMA